MSPIPALTVADFANRLGVVAPPGLANREIHGITTLEEATESQASFLVRAKLKAASGASKAGVILVPPKIQLDDLRVFPVPDVWAAVLELLHHFHPEPKPVPGVHSTAVVDSTAVIGPDVSIGPFCVIRGGVKIGSRVVLGAHCVVGEGTTIGDDSRLYDRVTIYHDCQIGRRVILHAGVVIGSDGFKYEVMNHQATKIPQVGIVVIEDDVEIGANSTIDRASFTTTRIGARTKIDNLVQVGHNVEIGSDCLICAHVGIGGSTKIGRGVIMGGLAGVGDNTTIGDGVRVAGMGGVHGKLPPGSSWSGTPALPSEEFRRIRAISRRLPDLYKRMKILADSQAASEDELEG